MYNFIQINHAIRTYLKIQKICNWICIIIMFEKYRFSGKNDSSTKYIFLILSIIRPKLEKAVVFFLNRNIGQHLSHLRLSIIRPKKWKKYCSFFLNRCIRQHLSHFTRVVMWQLHLCSDFILCNEKSNQFLHLLCHLY